MLKVSALYLDKQKSFVPKKKVRVSEGVVVNQGIRVFFETSC